MTKFALTYRGTVYPWQCDHMGHMNSMWYVGKFDEASWQFLASLGLTRALFREQGTGMVAVEQIVEYKRELYAGDIVSVRSAIVEVTDKALRIVHEMRSDETGELAAKTTIVGVHIDSKARKARSLPAEVRDRARMLITGEIGKGGVCDSELQTVSGSRADWEHRTAGLLSLKH